MSDERPAPVAEPTGVLQEVPNKPAPALIIGGMVAIVMVFAVVALWATELGPFEPAVAVADPTSDDIGGAFTGDAAKSKKTEPAPKKSTTYQEFELNGATPVAASTPEFPVAVVESTLPAESAGGQEPVSGLSPELAAALSNISTQIGGISEEVKFLRRETSSRFDRVETRLMSQKRRLTALEENNKMLVERFNVMEQHQAQMQSELLTGSSFGSKEAKPNKEIPSQAELNSPINFNEIPTDVIEAIRQVVVQELKASGQLKRTNGYAVTTVADIPPSDPVNSISSVDPLIPFELISVEAWDNEDMAVVSFAGRVATLALHQVRMNYRLVLVSRASGTAQFLNIKTKEMVTLKIS